MLSPKKVPCKSTQGSTMVETIVGFAVLCIALACFAGIMGLCLRMVSRSDEARVDMQNRYHSYYRREVPDQPVDAPVYSGTLEYSDGTTSFTLDASLQGWQYGESGQVLFFAEP